MTVGALEYVVIEEQGQRVRDELLPALRALQAGGAVRVVDLLAVSKDDAGQVTVRELDELPTDEQPRDEGLAGEHWGLLTEADVEALAAAVPPGVTTIVLLLEHTWANALTEAVQRGGGRLVVGGLVAPD